MALHFSANQYEGSYRPWRLGSWEVPKAFPGRPRIRKGRTKIIADDRGHLLRGTTRSTACPWGPLTQQIEKENCSPEVNRKYDHEERKVRIAEEKIGNSKQSDRNETATTLKKTRPDLQITGASLVDNTSNVSERSSSGYQGSDRSQTTSGTITPASFRQIFKIHSPMSKKKNSIKKEVDSSTSFSERSSICSQNIIEEAKKLPSDTIEDALLPKRSSNDDLDEGNQRALAIRLVEHPGATNCTKFTVLRPFTAPNSVTLISPPVLNRPKTSKTIRKISDIEFALKWDLKDEAIQEVSETLNKNSSPPLQDKRAKDPQTPRSVTSVNSEDSGIQTSPKRAWDVGPDSNDLSLRLEAVQNNNKTSNSSKHQKEPESGYGSPASSVAKSNNTISKNAGRTSGMNTRTPSSVNGFSESSRTPSMRNQERISIDSKCLSAKSNGDKESYKSMPRQVILSGKRNKTAPAQQKHEERDPLEIMETIDAVFHTVPRRESPYPPYQRNASRNNKSPQLTTFGTQTDQTKEETCSIQHNHSLKDMGNALRMRNCVACEMRAQETPPKKYTSQNGSKIPFRFGKPEKRIANKPRYIRQSDRFQSRLKIQHDTPRFWPINTLSSPFNNRPGYGQDQYPSHMRLKTTYQMAHTGNKKPQHTLLINKLYK